MGQEQPAELANKFAETVKVEDNDAIDTEKSPKSPDISNYDASAEENDSAYNTPNNEETPEIDIASGPEVEEEVPATLGVQPHDNDGESTTTETSKHEEVTPQPESKSSLMSFFRQSSGTSSAPSGDASESDRGYRGFLKQRDSHNSNNGSMENVSSVGSGNSTADEASSSQSSGKKSSHLSLKRFLKKFKPEDTNLFHNHHSKEKEKEKKEKDRARGHGHHHHHQLRKKFHILPQHPGSELYKKYTKGKLIGSGASGSVNLVHLRTDPSKIYAVKKFRAKLPNEAESDYKIKVNNEYKIGEILNHENLINTIELVKENNGGMFGQIEYYIIMEYCPFDFFNLVMSGLMDGLEINCYFRQVISGVAHLHEMGLAHRDLKLDNCVVNSQGILKLIDFGSAVQFRKSITQESKRPEQEIIEINGKTYKLLLSRGIVGSDPYLSPEVFDPDLEPMTSQSEDQTPVPTCNNITGSASLSPTCPDSEDEKTLKGYDARKVDVWSIAIIYCCMVLRRFPWKIPQESDSSYKSFTKNPDKLFKMLPKESTDLIKHMLCDKQDRYLIEDVLKHPFVQNINHCTTGRNVDDHKHHLITESELDHINKEREIARKLKNSGMA